MRTRIAVGVTALVALLTAAWLAPQAIGTMLVTFSVVVFLWAVVGLIRPDWGRLPNRLASVWVWVMSVGLLAGGAILMAPPEPNGVSSANPVNPAVVSADTWTDGEWPLTVDGGMLTCTTIRDVGLPAAFVSADGKMWPLNGVASSHHERWAAEPSIDPIWRPDPRFPDEARVPIGGLLQRALSLC